ncbi:allophanate hydrolase [Blastococcus sp. CT_GayMR16]|uniref:allophanate hydrolase n=1 Tax=Blastococcus sp. CT_GayMR16 TaxID=2559607 RepID=UPI00107422FD|nr:allophanate hydrolase [Blastococcus sp. CT_GayMR16]TFV89206.1 allophanate hydrolase [Blastococcus sp. CT_GayMR16]
MLPAPQPSTAGPTVTELLHALRSGATTVTSVVEGIADVVEERGDDGVWITTVGREELRERAAELDAAPGARDLPLFGIPFAVKDSIDVAGLPTTCGCPEYAYVPGTTAPLVDRLLDAGAVLVGKTNLDQFATGLNGTRSPYGIPRNVHGGDLIPGGSSSGSALAVATGQVPFAVATDTAGSGRVPAALNAIIGFKPSRGLLSTTGLVPACRSLDCMSLMGTTVDDVRRVFDVVAAVDPADPWSRPRGRRTVDSPRIGLPPAAHLEFLGDQQMRRAHEAAREVLPQVGTVVEIPLEPFLLTGELLYQGPWVAERLVEFGDFLAASPDAVHPVVAEILEGGRRYTAVDAFRAEHRLQELRAEVARLWADVDVVVLPAVPTTFTVADVLENPIATNTALGMYTHCGNLLDLCAVVVPAGATEDGRPCSLMVLGPALTDDVVLEVAARLTGNAPGPVGPAAPTTELVVVGHHLSGQPRNSELTGRGGVLLETTTTTGDYRLLRIGTDAPGQVPVPALTRSPGTGARIEVELWQLPAAELPGFLAGLPDVLALGRVRLADGRTVPGLVGDESVVSGSTGSPITDITDTGGWRRHLARPRSPLAPLPVR